MKLCLILCVCLSLVFPSNTQNRMHCVICGLFSESCILCVQYTLTVKADDGNEQDVAKVEIKIENVNDNPPVFLPYNNNITIEEEEIVSGCIVTVSDVTTYTMAVLYLF